MRLHRQDQDQNLPHTISTGNQGLDLILTGGLPQRRLYLLEGAPGSGKTTLALQFLGEGVKQGEKALYITLSETKEELSEVAASHGFDISEFDIFEFSSAAEVFCDGRDQSILHPWEMELGDDPADPGRGREGPAEARCLR